MESSDLCAYSTYLGLASLFRLLQQNPARVSSGMSNTHRRRDTHIGKTTLKFEGKPAGFCSCLISSLFCCFRNAYFSTLKSRHIGLSPACNVVTIVSVFYRHNWSHFSETDRESERLVINKNLKDSISTTFTHYKCSTCII